MMKNNLFKLKATYLIAFKMQILFICFFLVLCITGINAASYGANLVLNGDAETNSLANWTNSGPVFVALSPSGVGVSDSPSGGYAFDYYPGSASGNESLSQIIDITSLAADITTGSVQGVLSGEVKKFYAASNCILRVQELDASNALLHTSEIDGTTSGDVWVTTAVKITNLNVNTRKLKVILYAQVSTNTDDYIEFDNIRLTLYRTPTLTTTSVSIYDATSATLGGNVTANGGTAVTERGVVYSSIDATPTIGESEVTSKANGLGSGTFSESIASLSFGTTYYVQAYAINSVGTSYGGVVSFTTEKSIPLITWGNPSDIVYGTLLSATQLNATASVPGTYTYNPVLGTKLNSGSTQNLKVDFTPTDAVHYSSTSKTVTINVSKATPVITWSNPSEITYGTLLSATQLNANADVAGTIVYTPALDSKLNAGAAQNLKADFTPTDATNYNAATKSATIDVAKATPVITWSNPVEITYGTLLSATQLNASADVSGTIVYTPALDAKLNAGTAQNLKADFTPMDATNYNTATKTVTIDVAKATPVIIWSNPEDISNQKALSSTQLNATADVAGTFTYTPAIGTKLNVGDTQSLKADFEPTDVVNYETASKTVYINVFLATGISEVGNNKLMVFPNPVIDAFSVSGIEGRATISLTDLNGRVILTKEISAGEKISLTTLSSGIYIIKIETISGTILKKIVKN